LGSGHGICDQRWAWDRVVCQRWVVDVDQDARIGVLVKVLSDRPSWQGICAGAGDLEVHALWVCLGSIEVLCGVERDCLVAKDVFPWCNGRRDGYGPGVVVCDKSVGGPCAWRG
jgi:hypothetical protein